MINSSRDLRVWQKFMQPATLVCRLSQAFPLEEVFGLAAQMRPAAVSIPSDIAEGHGRLGAREYRQFLSVARVSNFELQTQLEIARLLSDGEPRLLREAEALSHEVGKMIYAVS